MLQARRFLGYRFACALVLCVLGTPLQTRAQDFDFSGGGGRWGGGDLGAPAEVTISAEFTAPTADRPAYVFVTAKIKDTFHISAIDQGSLPDGGGGPRATKIVLTPDSGVKLTGGWQPLEPPQSHIDKQDWVGLELREHFGQVTWYAPCELLANVDPAQLRITGTIEGQACNAEKCVPFESNLEAQIGNGFDVPASTVANTSAPSADTSATSNTTTEAATDISLLSILGYGILGGLILNLMPCVLPVIGLKVLAFAEQAGQSRGRILMLNLCYVAGLMTVFMILATLAALAQLGLTNESFGWGELNTLTWFKVSMTALVFAMALSFLGIWELPIPGFATSGQATALAAREGPLGAFCMGMFTTLLATPCSGPFLGPVLGFTISQPPAMIYAIFAAVGLGMALPYLLIGVFPSLVSWLPKPGAWMDTFKNLLGFVLLATVVFLFSTIKSDYFLATLSLLFGIWFGCWMIGRLPITATPAKRRNAWLEGFAAALIVGAGAFSFLTPQDKDHVLPWQAYSPEALAAARADGKVVMVDFTAQWCLTCKSNLKFAINRPEVKAWVEENNVVALLADWTDKNATIKQALLELNSRSIPLLAIYPADPSQAPIVLPDLVSKGEVLEALAAANAGNSVTDKSTMATKPAQPQFSLRQPLGATR